MNVFRKTIFFLKLGATPENVVPFCDGKKTTIALYFSLDKKKEEIIFNCGEVSIDTFECVNKNIHDIYRVCIDQKGTAGEIYPCICKKCKNQFFSKDYKETKHSAMCKSCKQEVIEKYISLEDNVSNRQFVYLMQCKETGSLKIGYSTNPRKRQKQLQTGNNSEIVILALLKGGQGLELKLHKLFSEYRVGGEWFRNVPEIIEYFEKNRLYRE